VTEDGVVEAVIDSTNRGCPVIAEVHWRHGGDHAVCIDETHTFSGTRYVCVCDPWDGELRLVEGAPGWPVSYLCESPISTHTFLGGKAHVYKGGWRHQGVFDGMIVRRK
jgi:hypothetical protein